jgi:hypothetical protein
LGITSIELQSFIDDSQRTTPPVSPLTVRVPELLPEQTVESELTLPPTLSKSTVKVASVELVSEQVPDLMTALYFVVSVRLL